MVTLTRTEDPEKHGLSDRMPLLIAGVSVCLIAVVAWKFDLTSIFHPSRAGIPAFEQTDWFDPARIDFGADYLAHVIPITFILFGMASIVPDFARRPLATLLTCFCLSSGWHVIGFNWYIPPHMVLSDAVDDILLIAAVPTTLVHVFIAFRTRGLPRIRAIVAACSIGALLIETAILHVLLILPAATVYDQQATWLKAAIMKPGVNIEERCRTLKLVCVMDTPDGPKVTQSLRPAGVPDIVLKRAQEAVAKYGIFDLPASPEPRIWKLRHRSFENFTGALRIPGVEVVREGRRIMIVDMSTAPIANLWVRAYTHLHMMPMCLVWLTMIVLVELVHRMYRR